jgi:hypothetical protein
MARDGVPDHTGDRDGTGGTHDTQDSGDEVVVPITAPGSGPRDFTISPPSPAETSRSADHTSRLEGEGRRRGGASGQSADHHGTDHSPDCPDSPDRPDSAQTGGTNDRHGHSADYRRTREPVGRSAAGTDGERAGEFEARTDDALDDDIVHGQAIIGPGADAYAGDPGTVVGHDRLADVVTTFGATLDAIRASQGRAPRHNMPTGSGTNQKRIAQVVQATPVEATRVIELIRSNAAQVPLLALAADDPAVGRGDVVFPGRLRMPGGTRRRVELRIYPTASGNLTVLELLPRRSWMPQTRRYLRAGVPAITALSDAIEEAEAPPTDGPGA